MRYLILLVSLVSFTLTSCNNAKEEGKGEGQDSAQVESKMPLSHEEMEMMEHQASAAPKESPYKDAKIDIKVFENKEANLSGYGYDILIFDALYVHQPHIPAINGNRGFKTKEQATKAAEFVIYKIRNNIMPPSLSVEELDSLGTLK